MVKIGIIGGTGLNNPKILKDYSKENVSTLFGTPSSALTKGTINGVDVIILARHGENHSIPPSNVNFRANIQALKDVGVTHIFAATAVGSLREEIKPGNLVFPNQFIDFTKHRKLTMFPDKVVHTPMAFPFSKILRDILSETANEFGFEFNRDVTIVTIEGPRFSSRAESLMFRKLGADIINMTTIPEVVLANEIGIPYQSIAMSTDYDCWKDGEESVNMEMILKIMEQNADNVKKLIVSAISKVK